jgi:hypothetical protein
MLKLLFIGIVETLNKNELLIKCENGWMGDARLTI